MISRSVAQIATASMRTSTSARFGTGIGLSISFNSPGSPSTHAFIVSGTGMSGLVFTPGGAYIECSLLFGRLRAMRIWRSAKPGRKRAHSADDLLADHGQMLVAR